MITLSEEVKSQEQTDIYCWGKYKGRELYSPILLTISLLSLIVITLSAKQFSCNNQIIFPMQHKKSL
jgi:hypothetical protein